MTSIFRTFRTVGHALRRNIMRSVLTCLGVIIGVAAVIAIMEIGNGSSAALQKSIASMGANTILVQPGQATSGGVSFGVGTAMTLTPEDCDAIIRECPSVAAAAPIIQVRTQIVYNNRNWVPLQIIGSTPAYLTVRNWTDMDEGDMFTDQDVRNAAKVCVIGATIAREVFQGEDPIGKEIRLQNVTFRVTGILARKGANMVGMDQDDFVLAPWTTIKYRVTGNNLVQSNQSAASSSSSTTATNGQLYPVTSTNLYPSQSTVQQQDTPLPVRFTNVNIIFVSSNSASQIPSAMAEMTDLLHQRHRIHAGEPDDFNMRDMTELTKTLGSATTLMTMLLLVVAMLSLVVGGVGIMNIMLVSVTERTREIGLRMAVGARSRDILRQFLIEAIALCLAGGAIGIVIGRSISTAIRLLLHWPIEASFLAIMISVFVSALVGITFGFYPAWKASRLDPIEALRYE